MPVPDTLQRRSDMFKVHGRISIGPEEFFSYPSWLSVLHGQGLRPQALVPQAVAFPQKEIVGYMKFLKKQVDATVGPMPTHAEYLSAFCAPRRGTQ